MKKTTKPRAKRFSMAQHTAMILELQMELAGLRDRNYALMSAFDALTVLVQRTPQDRKLETRVSDLNASINQVRAGFEFADKNIDLILSRQQQFIKDLASLQEDVEQLNESVFPFPPEQEEPYIEYTPTLTWWDRPLGRREESEQVQQLKFEVESLKADLELMTKERDELSLICCAGSKT